MVFLKLSQFALVHPVSPPPPHRVDGLWSDCSTVVLHLHIKRQLILRHPGAQGDLMQSSEWQMTSESSEAHHQEASPACCSLTHPVTFCFFLLEAPKKLLKGKPVTFAFLSLSLSLSLSEQRFTHAHDDHVREVLVDT